MRKHAAWYTKGLRDSNKYRDEINLIEKEQDFKDSLLGYLDYLMAKEAVAVL